MKLSNARYETRFGQVQLVVEIDGIEASFTTEENKLRRYGALYLGPDFEYKVPPVVLRVEGHRQTFQGCTQDARMLTLFDDYWQAMNQDAPIKLGPVKIPKA
jgi:hypothetical protein